MTGDQTIPPERRPERRRTRSTVIPPADPAVVAELSERRAAILLGEAHLLPFDEDDDGR